MKSHQLARALAELSSVLLAAPNCDIADLGPSAVGMATHVPKTALAPPTSEDAAFTLSALVALSKVSKNQWRAIIEDLGLPIDIPAAYSGRDTIGKILRFLESHPDALARLRSERATKSKHASPELMRTLELLLGGKGR